MRSVLPLVFAFMLMAGLALLWAQPGQSTGEAGTNTTTTTTTQGPCDVYEETIKIQDPDPPGMNYYNGYLVIVADGCAVQDVAVIWDYMPPRPHVMTGQGVYFKVYFNGTLVYEGASNIYDFPDAQYNGKTVKVRVEAYEG